MSSRKDSTLAALLKQKPKRGRPPSAVSRQNVYVALTAEQKEWLNQLTNDLPGGFSRADIPDLAVMLLAMRLELLQTAVSDRNRGIPEGITDLESIYLLWDLALPSTDEQSNRWTSIRLSPQQAIELGRVHGTLNALFGVNRSQVFALSLALFAGFAKQQQLAKHAFKSLRELRDWMRNIYL
jgi:hypothetical protein